MPVIKSRRGFASEKPFRSVRSTTSKIIFLSLEGSVTEEEYFKRISTIFDGVKSKIQFISVAEDAVNTPNNQRTPEQKEILSKTRPLQLAKRIEKFKAKNEEVYQFSKYFEDEFWIVTDVDNNWSDIKMCNGKTLMDEWEETITYCKKNGFRYAISNPFFEVWLLLHHDVPTNEDKYFAVTDTHEYEKTDHFRKRLEDLGVGLKRKKHIRLSDYNREKVKLAIERAENLHIDKDDLSPKYFATTVYLILKKVVDMLPKESHLLL